MERPLLNDSNTYPTDSMLAAALGNSSGVFQSFVSKLPDYQIGLE